MGGDEKSYNKIQTIGSWAATRNPEIQAIGSWAATRDLEIQAMGS